MERIKVSSSNIHSIGYDHASNMLEIKFNSSGIYQYYNVPKFVYDELIYANSHGKYFDKNIKTKYQYKKMII